MFAVDSDPSSADMIFTDNETDTARRSRVLHKRQLRRDKLSTLVTDKPHMLLSDSCNEPLNVDISSTALQSAPHTTSSAPPSAISTSDTGR